MGNTWDDRMTPRPKAAPTMELQRTLWTMRKARQGSQVLGPDRTITAGIYRTDAGLELRVVNGDNPNDLYDSLLSRTSDEPLEVRANELRAVLLEQGWMEAV